MNALLTSVLIAGASLSVFGQGTLYFANIDANGSTSLRVTNYLGNPFPPANSTSYKAGVYWAVGTGATESSLTLLPGGVTSLWTGFSGVFNGGIVAFPVPGGSTITFQVRVWMSLFSSYEEADYNQFNGDLSGKSSLMTVVLGNAPGIPVPTPAANYFDAVGVSRFGVVPWWWGEEPPIIPEPSAIGITLLGLGALVCGRRKRQSKR